jgi:iron(III) transport system ATP-binding protein
LVTVTFEHVSKSFGKVRAVDDATFTIGEGELFLLLGPSGCGKTTALRIVAGFYKPDSGTLKFDGKEVNDLPPYKRNTGMVFQNYALWPHMTVYENVAFGLKVRNVTSTERVERVKRILDIVRMRDYADRLPSQLSGGQQQRIALARALVIEPSVLLLDEPLSNLDAKLRLEMRSEIRRIQKHLGITTVYVTHDQAEALSLADRIAVMNLGRISQLGSPREVYEYPENRFVAGFMGEANVFDGTIETIRKETGTSRVKIDDHLRIEGRLPKDFATYSIGDKVSCFIRLESVLGNEPCEQKLQAKVLDTSYYGESERYELELPGKRILRAVRFNPTGRAFNPGETLEISLPAEKVIVLKE